MDASCDAVKAATMSPRTTVDAGGRGATIERAPSFMPDGATANVSFELPNRPRLAPLLSAHGSRRAGRRRAATRRQRKTRRQETAASTPAVRTALQATRRAAENA